MKLLITTSLIIMLFSFSTCKKDSTTEDQLPPETTTGAMTFGCKIDGKVFVPKDGNGHPGLYVQYVYLGSGSGGGWYLNIPAVNWSSSLSPALKIGTDSLLVKEDSTYDFKLDSNFKTIKGTVYAHYANGADAYSKLNNDSGSLFIKKHDLSNHILSGTFFFTGTNSSGTKVNITDGRFDIKY